MADEQTPYKMTPRDYGKLRGVAPQLVYYHIRAGHLVPDTCDCGRKVIIVEEADELFRKEKDNG